MTIHLPKPMAPWRVKAIKEGRIHQLAHIARDERNWNIAAPWYATITGLAHCNGKSLFVRRTKP